MKKLYIKTFGCQMNEYDSEKMAAVLGAEQELMPTQQIDEADIVLFNTCSIREKAQEKVFSDLGRARELKKLKPDLILGVGGCVASQEGAALLKRAPYVDVVFGPQTLHRLPQLIQARQQSGRSQVDVSFPEIEKFDHLPAAKRSGCTAFVSIMEGCSKYCSYCVVPFTRGEEVSRPLEDVLAEVAGLVEQGVREVTLLGQNVNAYRAQSDDGEPADLALLIECIAAMDDILRIRFITSHPSEFSQRLVDVYRRVPKLVSHVHLPVQHASDKILAAMKRSYTLLEYKNLVKRLRQARPDLSLSSDFIVGFPGETEADFEKLMQLVTELQFDASYSFVFSPRPGTPAANLPDDTPAEVKLARLQRLQSLLDAQELQFAQAMLGNTVEVLVEGTSRKNANEIYGRAPNNHVVNFAGEASLIGQMVSVKITAVSRHTLRGEWLPSQPAATFEAQAQQVLA